MLQVQRQFAKSAVKVGAIGFGAMGAGSNAYGQPLHQNEMDTLLKRALDLGCNHWDTSDIYTVFSEGTLGYSEKQIGSFFKSHPGSREKVFLATKFGFTIRFKNKADAAYVKSACQDSLSRLGVSHIDLYYLHRKSPDTPIEESIGAMKELQEAGLIKFIGVSELNVEDLERAEKVAHVDALQIELSAWTPQILSNGIMDWCKKNGTALVAYSPLGRGGLTGEFKAEQLDEKDSRRSSPRFLGEAFEHNKQLVNSIKSLAEEKSCSAAQISLAWILAQDVLTLPIPGTRQVKYLEDNVGASKIELSPEELKELDHCIYEFTPKGDRYKLPASGKSNVAF